MGRGSLAISSEIDPRSCGPYASAGDREARSWLLLPDWRASSPAPRAPTLNRWRQRHRLRL